MKQTKRAFLFGSTLVLALVANFSFGSMRMSFGSVAFANSTSIAAVAEMSVEALKVFKTEFEAEEGKPLTDQVLGWEWKSTPSETMFTIFEVKTANEVSSELYDCHYDGPKLAQCDYLQSISRQTHVSPPRINSVAEMLKAFSEALLLVDSKIDRLADVTSLKIWQDGSLMQVKVTSKVGVSALSCHRHGPGIDCHRQRRVGPAEPRSP